MQERKPPRIPQTEEQCREDSMRFDECWSLIYSTDATMDERSQAVATLYEATILYQFYLKQLSITHSNLVFNIEKQLLNTVIQGFYHYRKAED